MSKRERATRERADKATQTFKELLAGSWTKVAVMVGAIVVALWQFGGFGDRLTVAESRISTNESDVEVLDARTDALGEEVADLDEAVDEIQEGVSDASEQLNRVTQLLKDLQKIRQQLIDAFQQGTPPTGHLEPAPPA